MPFSTAYRNSILDYVLGNGVFSIPATVYVGLSYADPTSDGSGIDEPTDSNYARVSLTNNSTSFPGASGGSKSNGIAVQFPKAGENWTSPVTHIFLSDAVSGGNLIAYTELDAPLNIEQYQIANFDIASLVFSLVDYP